MKAFILSSKLINRPSYFDKYKYCYLINCPLQDMKIYSKNYSTKKAGRQIPAFK